MALRGYSHTRQRNLVSFKGPGILHLEDVVTVAIVWFMRRRGYNFFASIGPDNSAIHSITFKREPL
jgi:hypothetical protein